MRQAPGVLWEESGHWTEWNQRGSTVGVGLNQGRGTKNTHSQCRYGKRKKMFRN